MEVEMRAIPLKWDDDLNIIVGQSHFIKTVEDLSEILVSTVPGIEFGLAFCEASGPCLIRTEGNDPGLIEKVQGFAEAVGAGHAFFILMRHAYPINVLTPIKNCPEVCRIFCATANPLQILTAETSQGKGIVGVIDGFSPRGVETSADKEDRNQLLRKIGYKY